MAYYVFLWTDEIISHLAEHDVTPEMFQDLVCDPEDLDTSRTSGKLAAFGHTPDGRYLIAVYELLDDGLTVVPITPKPRC